MGRTHHSLQYPSRGRGRQVGTQSIRRGLYPRTGRGSGDPRGTTSTVEVSTVSREPSFHTRQPDEEDQKVGETGGSERTGGVAVGRDIKGTDGTLE